MDTDEAWESFIGIRKSNKGYADTIAAALNDIKTDTANLAKLTNQLLGDQKLMENSPEEPSADLGAGQAMPGSDEMPEEADNRNALDDAMSVIDEQVGGGEAPAETVEEASVEEGPATDDITAEEVEVAPEAPEPAGGMAPEGMVPQPEASFDTECIQFAEKAKKELQNVTGAGDYYKARRLIGIITDIEKIINSDDNPDTILKGEDPTDNGAIVEDESATIAASEDAVPVEEDSIAKSDCDQETAEAMPASKTSSSEGERKSMPVPEVDMEKGDDDMEIPVRGSAGMAGKGNEKSIADSDDAEVVTEGIAESCDAEPIEKSAAPDVLPSFASMLAHRRGQSSEDGYVAFVKSAKASLQREVDEHFGATGFAKSADGADIAKADDDEMEYVEEDDYDDEDDYNGEDDFNEDTLALGQEHARDRLLSEHLKNTPVRADDIDIARKTPYARAITSEKGTLTPADKSRVYYDDDDAPTGDIPAHTVPVLTKDMRTPLGRMASQGGARRADYRAEEGNPFGKSASTESVSKSATPDALPSFSSIMAHRRGAAEDPLVPFAKSYRDLQDFHRSDEPAADAGEPTVRIEKGKKDNRVDKDGNPIPKPPRMTEEQKNQRAKEKEKENKEIEERRVQKELEKEKKRTEDAQRKLGKEKKRTENILANGSHEEIQSLSDERAKAGLPRNPGVDMPEKGLTGKKEGAGYPVSSEQEAKDKAEFEDWADKKGDFYSTMGKVVNKKPASAEKLAAEYGTGNTPASYDSSPEAMASFDQAAVRAGVKPTPRPAPGPEHDVAPKATTQSTSGKGSGSAQAPAKDAPASAKKKTGGSARGQGGGKEKETDAIMSIKDSEKQLDDLARQNEADDLVRAAAAAKGLVDYNHDKTMRNLHDRDAVNRNRRQKFATSMTGEKGARSSFTGNNPDLTGKVGPKITYYSKDFVPEDAIEPEKTDEGAPEEKPKAKLGRPFKRGDESTSAEQVPQVSTSPEPAPEQEAAEQSGSQDSEQAVAEKPVAEPEAKPQPYQKRTAPIPYKDLDGFLADFEAHGGNPDYARKAVKGLMQSRFFSKLTPEELASLPKEAQKVIKDRRKMKRQAESIAESGASDMMKSATLEPFSDIMARYRRART